MIDDEQFHKKKGRKRGFFFQLIKALFSMAFLVTFFFFAYFFFFGNREESGPSVLMDNIVKEEEIPLEEKEAVLVEVEELYYYNQLSDEEKERYLQVYEAITTRKETEISATSEDQIEKVFRFVINDHPELFYVQGYQYSIYTDAFQRTKKMAVEGLFLYDEEETAKLQKQIDVATEQILSTATGLTDDFSKVKFVFDYIVKNTKYVEGAKDNQNICSVLLTHESVCQGYAMSAQYLLNKMGVPTTLVIGKADGGAHAWNLVYADHDYYYMDVTWGDMDYRNSDGDLILDSNVLHIDYNCLLATSNLMGKSHQADDAELLPECVATKDNYYVHEDLLLEEANEDRIEEIISRGDKGTEEAIQFQCATEEIYDYAYDYLLEQEGIFDLIPDLENISYYNSDETWTFYFWRG